MNFTPYKAGTRYQSLQKGYFYDLDFWSNEAILYPICCLECSQVSGSKQCFPKPWKSFVPLHISPLNILFFIPPPLLIKQVGKELLICFLLMGTPLPIRWD